METNLADFIKDTPQGREADAILRKCVHCGFCTATCPTYQLLGDELDGPRGRIYLMKQVLEGAPATEKTQLHLDRCLTCRSCETTCPSGVQYGRLLDIGRAVVDEQVGRSPVETIVRSALRSVIPDAARFNPLLKLGQLARPLLPGALKRKVPVTIKPSQWPASSHARKMVVLDGCVQPGLSPNTNAAAARVLDKLGITLVRAAQAGCCGAVSYHLNAQEEGLDYMRRNIDAWWPHIEQGAEAIVMTASGCGAMVAEYGHLLAHDRAYAEKAARVSALMKDVSEVIAQEKDTVQKLARSSVQKSQSATFAFHPPCTLQHGLKMKGQVEKLLVELGFNLTPVKDAHLCCGSAGTYSILQPAISQQLLKNKISALTAGAPAAIITANIGCQMHLQTATGLPVMHWIEALDCHLAPY
ncbi:MAG: glycolate oxidase iron-sulfur subunit [Betaproteobacteria bacterium]|nr:glycolate oxidase iron-sulfur subunit [Betaproteobacteria bacterium]